MLALDRDMDIARLRPEEWLANLIIAGTVDEEAKKELMKINNPDMEKVKKAANTHEKQKNSLKSTASTSKAFQIKTNNNDNGNSNKPITCYAILTPPFLYSYSLVLQGNMAWVMPSANPALMDPFPLSLVALRP